VTLVLRGRVDSTFVTALPSTLTTLSNSVPRRTPGPWFTVVGLAVVFCVAFAARLIPLLRGGGLHAMGNYDDGVHYAAAMGLVHGLLPYRDFLLLHPPGVPLLLVPFAWLAEVLGEPDAMVVARLCWMAIGGLNAVLCGLVLLPLGRLAAVLTGLMYAVYFAAAYVEHTVLLEPPATTVLLLALVITRALEPGDGVGTAHYVIAGLLLGLSPTLKIWGVVAVLVVAGGLAWRRGLRPGLTVLLSAVASCTVVCLPFFLAAPQAMWQMVVVDQVGRRRVAWEPVKRVDDILGLSLWTEQPRLHLGTVLIAAVLLASLLVCLRHPELRLLAALLIGHGLLLAMTPYWFLHYAAVIAAPLVLVLGAGLAVLLRRAMAVRPWLPAAVASLAIVAVLVSALPLIQHRQGRSFPGPAAAAIVADLPGCVLTDFPMALIQMNLLRRNLERGCRFEVDLGGASYHQAPGPEKEKPRHENEVWQAYALEYLRTGDAVIIARFSSGSGFSPKTAKIVRSWPELGRAERYVIRKPQP
jgi:alpha-1,2-mannosyltransferase